MDKTGYWHIYLERFYEGIEPVSIVMNEEVYPVRQSPPASLTVCLRGPYAKYDRLVTAYLHRVEAAGRKCIYRIEENRSLSAPL